MYVLFYAVSQVSFSLRYPQCNVSHSPGRLPTFGRATLHTYIMNFTEGYMDTRRNDLPPFMDVISFTSNPLLFRFVSLGNASLLDKESSKLNKIRMHVHLRFE